jgi:tetratricopeptide (TPR) repeat protein
MRRHDVIIETFEVEVQNQAAMLAHFEIFGAVLEDSGRDEAAALFYEKAIRRFPNYWPLSEALLRTLLRTNRVADGVRILESRVETNERERPWLYMRIGDLYSRLGRTTKVTLYNEKGLETPLRRLFYKRQADLYRRSCRLKEAEKLTSKAKQDEHCAVWAYEEEISLLASLDQFFDVSDVLVNFIERFPDRTESYCGLWCWIKLFMPDQTLLSILSEIAAKRSEYWVPQVYLARAYVDLGKTDLAISILTQCPSSIGDRVKLWTLGHAYRESADPKRSLESFIEAASIDGGVEYFGQAAEAAAEAAFLNNEWDISLEFHFKLAQHLNSDEPDDLATLDYDIALIYAHQGKYEECQLFCQKSLDHIFASKAFTLCCICTTMLRGIDQSVIECQDSTNVQNDPALWHEFSVWVYRWRDLANTTDMAIRFFIEGLKATQSPPNTELMTLLHEAPGLGNEDILRSALDAAGPLASQIPNHESSPLFLAIRGRKATVITLLLERGAKSTQVTSEGVTTLQIAVTVRCQEIIEILLSAGVDVNNTSPSESPAIGLAAMLNLPEAVGPLLSHGADPNL